MDIMNGNIHTVKKFLPHQTLMTQSFSGGKKLRSRKMVCPKCKKKINEEKDAQCYCNTHKITCCFKYGHDVYLSCYEDQNPCQRMF